MVQYILLVLMFVCTPSFTHEYDNTAGPLNQEPLPPLVRPEWARNQQALIATRQERREGYAAPVVAFTPAQEREQQRQVFLAARRTTPPG